MADLCSLSRLHEVLVAEAGARAFLGVEQTHRRSSRTGIAEPQGVADLCQQVIPRKQLTPELLSFCVPFPPPTPAMGRDGEGLHPYYLFSSHLEKLGFGLPGVSASSLLSHVTHLIKEGCHLMERSPLAF